MIQKTKGPLVVICFAELDRPSRNPEKPRKKSIFTEEFNDRVTAIFIPSTIGAVCGKGNKKSSKAKANGNHQIRR